MERGNRGNDEGWTSSGNQHLDGHAEGSQLSGERSADALQAGATVTLTDFEVENILSLRQDIVFAQMILRTAISQSFAARGKPFTGRYEFNALAKTLTHVDPKRATERTET